MAVDSDRNLVSSKKKVDSSEKENHIKIHKELHESFDKLVADFIIHTEKLPSKTTVWELMEWSYIQTIDPDPS